MYPRTSSGSSNLWERVSDAHSQPPSLALLRGRASNLGLGSPPGGSGAAWNFRTTALKPHARARFSGSSAPVVSGLEHLGVETPGLCTDSRSRLCDCARRFPCLGPGKARRLILALSQPPPNTVRLRRCHCRKCVANTGGTNTDCLLVLCRRRKINIFEARCRNRSLFLPDLGCGAQFR